MPQEIYDVIIIGGGPAGLTAAIYASRMNMRTLLLECSSLGGRAIEAPNIENFPGFPKGIVGAKLTDKLVKQAERFGAEIRFPEEVLDLTLDDRVKTVVTRDGKYQGLGVIIATGAQRKKLLVPGESEFIGRGVSYCAVCDGPLFRDKVTAVVGFNDEALEDALYLSNFSKKVIIITQKDELESAKTLIDRCIQKANIEIQRAKVKSILGNGYVKAVKVLDLKSNKEDEIPVDGVFIFMGGLPMSNLVKKAGVTVDESGCIKVDRKQATNLEGVFAAGDCTCGGMQVVTAVGEGAMAAIQTYRHVKRNEK